MSEAINKSKVWNSLADNELDDLSSHRLNSVAVEFILDEVIENELDEEDNDDPTETR